MGRSYVSKFAFPGVSQVSELPAPNTPWFLRIETERFSVPCLRVRHAHPRAVLLYLHGNAMCLNNLKGLVKRLSVQLGCDVIAPEIPGTQYDWGRTAWKEGEPQPASEDGYYEAALGAYDWAAAQYPDIPLVVFGQSLGTGAACEVAYRRSPHGLVLQSPLLSAVRVIFPRLFTLPGTDIFVSCSKVPFFKCPTVIFHGAHDGVIHVEHGRRMAQLLPEGVLRQYVEYPEADHNDMEQRHLPHMLETLDKLLTSLTEGQQ